MRNKTIKETILEMAKNAISGRPVPTLASSIQLDQAETQHHDPVFDEKLRSLRPDWFKKG